jgi:hypothetical protein
MMSLERPRLSRECVFVRGVALSTQFYAAESKNAVNKIETSEKRPRLLLCLSSFFSCVLFALSVAAASKLDHNIRNI